MYKRIYILVLFFLVVLTACSERVGQKDAFQGALNSDVILSDEKIRDQQSKHSQYLAYRHHITIDLPQEDLVPTYERIKQNCLNQKSHSCTILHTELKDGRHISGRIKMRIAPEGISKIVEIAQSKGELINQSTTVEDIRDAIVDNQKRLDMLVSYRDRLSHLEKSSDIDVDSLIKIASELSVVQTDLEYAEGEKAKLLQRINTDIVIVRFVVQQHASFNDAILDALADFRADLSEGIAQTITFLAFLLPMLTILVPLIYLVKFIWGKRKNN